MDRYCTSSSSGFPNPTSHNPSYQSSTNPYSMSSSSSYQTPPGGLVYESPEQSQTSKAERIAKNSLGCIQSYGQHICCCTLIDSNMVLAPRVVMEYLGQDLQVVFEREAGSMSPRDTYSVRSGQGHQDRLCAP